MDYQESGATLRDKTADRIRRMIIEGELKPGDKLSERKMSKAMGVSTTPIKEALRILQTEGLIYSLPRKGSFVSDTYKKNVLQMIFIRSSLEGTAAYFASMEAGASDIEKMENALSRAKAIIDGEIPAKEGDLARCSDEFHNALRNASKNQYLVSLIQNLRSVDIIIRTVANKTIGDESRRAYQEHYAILQAVKSGAAEEAEQRIINHIRRVAIYTMDQREGF